ncbi:hypothetical protein DACRYDRAFT_45407, partial [Dacryopinax primogenitus]
TPNKILHTYLLRLVKYTFSITVDHLEKDRSQDLLSLIEACMNLLQKEGWNLPKLNAKYIMEHQCALIGKHLKMLVQCMPFVLWDMVVPELLKAWVMIGLTGALLWQYNIKVKEVYLAELQQALTSLVHAIAHLDPIKMISKPKLHILLHATDDIQRCGPAVGFTTERYKSYNLVFRTCSVNSNHQSPSPI